MSSTTEGSKSFDALKTLHDAQTATLKSLSERSFSVALQTLTLDLGVVAGLVASKARFSSNGEWIAIALLATFHALVMFYLFSKARAHHRERIRLDTVASAIAGIADLPSTFSAVSEPSFSRSFFGGSGIFMAAVSVGLALAVCAVRTSVFA